MSSIFSKHTFVYFVYLLECGDGSIYTGVTTNVERRFAEHKSGKGAKYTCAKGAKRILHVEKYKDRSSAQKRELEIKSWGRAKKLKLLL